MEPLNIGNKRYFTITTHSFLLYRHQKTKFFENFREFFGEFETFLKRILELFSGNSGKNFRPQFGNYAAKPCLSQPTVEMRDIPSI